MSLLRLVPGEFLAGRFRGVGLNVNQRSFSQTELQVLQVYQSIRCIRVSGVSDKFESSRLTVSAGAVNYC